MHHGIKKLLLLGAGHAHVHVLSRLAQNRPADLDVTVITPYPYQTYSGMTPGLVAGHYSEEDCQIPLEPLIKAAGAKWVRARCTGIDAGERRVRLSPAGQSRSQGDILPPDLPYHLLSIDTGAVIDRQRLEAEMPGAATNALIVRPIEVFATLWPQVLEQAQARPLSVAMIGAGAGGLELLFAAEQRLRTHGVAGTRFTLITGGVDLDSDTLKVALVTSSYTPSAAHTVWTDVSANEVAAGAGYATGGVTLANPVATNSTIDYDDAVWTALTKTFRYAVGYKVGTVGALTNPLLFWILLDTTPADIISSGSNYTIQWNSTNKLFYRA